MALGSGSQSQQNDQLKKAIDSKQPPSSSATQVQTPKAGPQYSAYYCGQEPLVRIHMGKMAA